MYQFKTFRNVNFVVISRAQTNEYHYTNIKLDIVRCFFYVWYKRCFLSWLKFHLQVTNFHSVTTQTIDKMQHNTSLFTLGTQIYFYQSLHILNV